MKYKNKLIISICIVTMLAILIVSATFAYWTWRVDVQNQTDVSFEVIGTGLSAHIEGNGNTEVNDLIPSGCGEANTIKKEVIITYKNETDHTATISSTLKTTSFALRNTSIVPTSEQLQKLRYVLTTTSDSCDANIAIDLDGNEINGDFSSLEFDNGLANNLPLEMFSYTFQVDGNMTQEKSKTYYLWIWLDESYEHQNVGNQNTDPMQGLEFTVEWSGNIIQNEN